MRVVAIARGQSWRGGLSGIATENKNSNVMRGWGQRHQRRRNGRMNSIWAGLGARLEAGETGIPHRHFTVVLASGAAAGRTRGCTGQRQWRNQGRQQDCQHRN